MPSKLRKSPNKQNIAIATIQSDDGEEIGVGSMIYSRTLKPHGYEARASLSRVNPNQGFSGPGDKETSSYFHISNSATPFQSDANGIGAVEAIELCQKAFYLFPAFRNPVLMQAYLANSALHFSDDDGEVLNFYRAWAKKCNLWNVSNNFFLEWFRSGNVFPYAFDGDIKLAEVRDFIGLNKAEAKARRIPLKYAILNPADIKCLGSSAFTDPLFGKLLNAYEVEKLRLKGTDEDKRIFEGLDSEAQRAIMIGQSPVLKLDPARLRPAFNAKQDYEPMAVPPYFGVLRDINFKQIMRAAEEKVAASADYCILLITAGEKERDEKQNKNLIDAMAKLFTAQSVGRVLFGHYTTEAKFIIPDLNEIFGPEKYVNVDKDIINGMNDIMASDENFATGQTKTKIYLQLLSQARESFLTYFLIPEMDRIAKEMGFRNAPAVEFEEITLESLNEGKKMFNRLFELGALTPQEVFHAYRTNQLPSSEKKALESQKEFKAQKKAGLYTPLLNQAPEGGRPTGAKAPKTKNTISPKGQASFEKLKENFSKMSDLSNEMQGLYKKKNSLARLSKSHKDLCDAMWVRVLSSEKPENWQQAAASIIDNPAGFDFDNEQYAQICDIMAESQIGMLESAMLFHSSEN